MNLRFSPRATANLAEIADYLHARDPAAARRVRASILASLQNLTVFPRLGRRQTVPGVRKLITPRYRYLVYYTIDDATSEIIILSVRHPSQRPEHSNA
jgi:toxin ParE1/3/4